ncbi:MAG: acetate uptake transporter [Firmicutes bacterium]|nr:acetate uptake transporter [Bacillota bacterium]
MSASFKLGNPAVVGLAGFGLTTLVLQLHNLGLCGVAPVLVLGLVFGGAAQLFAGFQEMKVGNNFGFCAFTGYGAFWIGFVLLKLSARYGVFEVTGHDVGYFLIAYTIFTFILWVASMKITKGHFVIFSLLLLGFVLLDLEHFGFPGLKLAASLDLIACALSALYGMAHVVLGDAFGRDVLPMGGPLFESR